jgi:hypothetical protein
MRRKHLLGYFLIILAGACAKYAIVPPAVNLLDYADVGLVTFKVENATGDLDEVGTQFFLEQVQRTQRVPIAELGGPTEVLERTGGSAFGLDTAKALGAEFGVRSFFVGEIKISKVKPQVDIIDLINKGVAARTKFDIAVSVRLISTESGATIWTESVTREGTVGFFSMSAGRVPFFSLRDKNNAVNDLLREIMFQLTWDFRPTRRRI